MFAAETSNKKKTPGEPKHKQAEASLNEKAVRECNPVWQSLALCPASIRPKLAVSQPDDPYEQEADRVADRVMRMANPPSNNSQSIHSKLSYSPIVSRKASDKSASCEEDEEIKLPRKELRSNTDTTATAPTIVHEALSSPGQRLDPITRSYMEERFDHDFGQVRVHTDAKATASARAVNAFAYTFGKDIVFGTECYAPSTNEGKRLIAHELTHVIQQGSSTAPNGASFGRGLRELTDHNPSDRTDRMTSAPGVYRPSRMAIQRDGPNQLPDPNLVDTSVIAVPNGVDVRVHDRPLATIRGTGVSVSSVRAQASIVTQLVLEGPGQRILRVSIHGPSGSSLELNEDTIHRAEADGYTIQISLTSPPPAVRHAPPPPRPQAPEPEEAPPPPLPAPRSLNASVDPDMLSGQELEDELARISDWLGRHPESSDEREHIEQSWEVLDRAHLARWSGMQQARQMSSLDAAMARAAGFPAPHPDQHFINGFVGAAAFEIRPANWDMLLQEILRGQAAFSLGATVGLLVGALRGLWDNIVALVELVCYLSPPGIAVSATQEAADFARNREGYAARRSGQVAEALRLLGALANLVQQALTDPGFMTEFSEELGELAGRATGEWFNEDFMQLSTFNKGQAVGKVGGRILIEALLLVFGPEEWVARGAAATGQSVRISAELERALVRIAEHIPELRPLLRLRETRAFTQGVHDITEAGRAVETVSTAARRVIRGPEDMMRHYGGRLRSTGGSLEEMWRRTAQAENPVHRRASSHEMHTLIRYLEHGAPDGRAVARLDLIPSRSGSRTPDFVMHFVDGSVERVEITAVTSAPRGTLSTGAGTGIGARERLAEATLQRSNVSAANIAEAIRRKAGAGNQLLAPLPGVPTGGTLIIHVTEGGVTTAIADEAMARVANQLGPEVRRIEIAFLERSAPNGPLRRAVRAYTRTDTGGYLLIP